MTTDGTITGSRPLQKKKSWVNLPNFATYLISWYRSLNATVAKPKNGHLESILRLSSNVTTAFDNTGTLVRWNIHRLMPLLSDEVVVFFSSIVVLNQNGNFWVVPLLHSVSDMTIPFTRAIYGDLLKLNVEHTGIHNFTTNFILLHQEIGIVMKSGTLCLSPTQFTKYINILLNANDSECSAKFIFINKHMKPCLISG